MKKGFFLPSPIGQRRAYLRIVSQKTRFKSIFKSTFSFVIFRQLVLAFLYNYKNAPPARFGSFVLLQKYAPVCFGSFIQLQNAPPTRFASFVLLQKYAPVCFGSFIQLQNALPTRFGSFVLLQKYAPARFGSFVQLQNAPPAYFRTFVKNQKLQ